MKKIGYIGSPFCPAFRGLYTDIFGPNLVIYVYISQILHKHLHALLIASFQSTDPCLTLFHYGWQA